MRKYFVFFLSLILLLTACGKTQSTPTWQEQYDLGVRYLSEGNYEEAIIAFSAAIEIDPQQADAYLGLGDAYLAMGFSEQAFENYNLAAEYGSLLAKEKIGELTSDGKIEDVFTQSTTFRIFDDLPENAMQAIKRMKSALYSEDIDIVTSEFMAFDHAIFDSIIGAGQRDYYLRTFDTEKIALHYQVDPDNPDWVVVDFEIRPFVGTAYYIELLYRPSTGNEPPTVVYTTGECQGWNWNGHFDTIDTSFSVLQDGTPDVEIHKSSGTLVNGLIDGEVAEESNKPDDHDGNTKYYSEYSMGKPVYGYHNKFEAYSGDISYSYIYGPSGEKIYFDIWAEPLRDDMYSSYSTGGGNRWKDIPYYVDLEYELSWN